MSADWKTLSLIIIIFGNDLLSLHLNLLDSIHPYVIQYNNHENRYY